ncbi:MAG: hypothetical protein AB1644_04120 [Candidatus Zixiibacteriota bacterium]
MKRATALIILCGLGLLTGCIPFAVSPWYQEKDLVFDPALIGVWSMDDPEGDDERYQFEQSGPDEYTLTHTDDGRKSLYSAHLFKLGDQLCMDVYAKDPLVELDGMFADHSLMLHSFYVVHAIAPVLAISTLEYDWLKEYLKDPGMPAHIIDDNRIVFTAQTSELQALVLKNLANDSAFCEPEVLKWVANE